MKKIILILFGLLLFNMNNVQASTPTPHQPKAVKILSAQIYKMLGAKIVPTSIRGSKAEVRVTVNEGNYLRVLSIKSENEELASYIKSSIDFEKLALGTFKKGIVYRIPIEVAK